VKRPIFELVEDEFGDAPSEPTQPLEIPDVDEAWWAALLTAVEQEQA
jgi:hypothetical protein